MDWAQLDIPTRAGFLAAVMAVMSLLIPPISVASALVAIAFSAVGWARSRSRGEVNRVARLVVLAGVVFIGLIVAGNAIYSANN